MGNKNSYMRRNLEVPLPTGSGNGNNKKERSGQLNGFNIYDHAQHNRSKMGEAVRQLANGLGFTAFIYGFIVNFDNLIGWSLGAVAVVFGVIKCFHARENLFIRRIERKEKQRNFKYNRELNEEEDDEIEKYKAK